MQGPVPQAAHGCGGVDPAARHRGVQPDPDDDARARGGPGGDPRERRRRGGGCRRRRRPQAPQDDRLAVVGDVRVGAQRHGGDGGCGRGHRPGRAPGWRAQAAALGSTPDQVDGGAHRGVCQG